MNREKSLESALAAACTFLVHKGYFTKEDFLDIDTFKDIETKIMRKLGEGVNND